MAPINFDSESVCGSVCACGDPFLQISNISVQHFQSKVFYFDSDMRGLLVI